MDRQVAIYEADNSINIKKLIPLSSFTTYFQGAYDKDQIHSVYMNEAGDVVAKNTHDDILPQSEILTNEFASSLAGS